MAIATCFIQEKYAGYVIKTRDIIFSAETTSISDVSDGKFRLWHIPAENHGIPIHLNKYSVQNDECSYEDSLQAHFVEGRALCTYSNQGYTQGLLSGILQVRIPFPSLPVSFAEKSSFWTPKCCKLFQKMRLCCL